MRAANNNCYFIHYSHGDVPIQPWGCTSCSPLDIQSLTVKIQIQILIHRYTDIYCSWWRSTITQGVNITYQNLGYEIYDTSRGWHAYHLDVPIIMKSDSLNHLEASGPVQAFTGISLPLTSPLPNTARCVETAFQIFIHYVSIILLILVGITFSNIEHRMTILQYECRIYVWRSLHSPVAECGCCDPPGLTPVSPPRRHDPLGKFCRMGNSWAGRWETKRSAACTD